jgi:aminoglycoside 2''-phosphotransferase
MWPDLVGPGPGSWPDSDTPSLSPMFFLRGQQDSPRGCNGSNMAAQRTNEELVRAALGGYSIRSLRWISDGLQYLVAIVNEDWVVRLPRTTEAGRELLREAELLRGLGPFVSLSVPAYDRVVPEWGRYPLLPGVSLSRNRLLRSPASLQAEQGSKLGRFLKDLHQAKAVVRGEGLERVSSAQWSRDGWLKLLADVRAELYPFLSGYARDWIEEHFEPVVTGALSLDHDPVLIHGDLAPYHILVDPLSGALTGVLDFGVAGLGDPAADFAALLIGYGEQFVSYVLATYPELSAAADRARFWAGGIEVWWALKGLQTRDPSWSVCHLAFARDILPVGLPSR